MDFCIKQYFCIYSKSNLIYNVTGLSELVYNLPLVTKKPQVSDRGFLTVQNLQNPAPL